jgi:hypothetical protein
MISTFQALAVAAIALLPGAMYVWGFERTVGGRWGLQLADRLPRFFGYSAIFQALLSPATYWFYANYIRPQRFQAGRPLPLWLWVVAVAYVVIPYVTGRVIGTGVRKEWRWAALLAGKSHAPRAWDHLFSPEPVAWIRIKLKSGPWIAGAFALDHHGRRRSYAAGYPHEQDLYLAEQLRVDPETGDLELDGDGNVLLLGRGVLIRWSEIEYLTYTDAE